MNLNLLPIVVSNGKNTWEISQPVTVYMLIFWAQKRLVIHNQRFRFCRLIVEPVKFFTRSRLFLFRFVSFPPDQPPLVMGGALPKPAFGQVSPTMPPTWGDSQQLETFEAWWLDETMRYVYVFIYIYMCVMYVYIYICKFKYTIDYLYIYICIYICTLLRTNRIPSHNILEDDFPLQKVGYVSSMEGMIYISLRFEIQYWKDDEIATCTMLVPFGWKINARIWSIERHLMHRYFNWERTHLKC